MVGAEFRQSTRRQLAPSIAALALLLSSEAGAGEFYGSFGLAITGARAHADGDNGDALAPVATPRFSGTSTDTSPLASGAVGFEFSIRELRPSRRRLPAWLPDVDLDDWRLRTELEATGARSYDLIVDADLVRPPLVQQESITLMLTQWLDLPLGHAIEAVAGRARGIEDLTLNVGLGIGYGRSTIAADNFASFGKKDLNEMVWQAGVELGYPISNSLTLTGGYRYVDLGLQETRLRDSTGVVDHGRLKLGLDSHEFRAAIRVRFYSVRFPRGLFESKRHDQPGPA